MTSFLICLFLSYVGKFAFFLVSYRCFCVRLTVFLLGMTIFLWVFSEIASFVGAIMSLKSVICFTSSAERDCRMLFDSVYVIGFLSCVTLLVLGYHDWH